MTANNTVQLILCASQMEAPRYKDCINRIGISPTTQVIDRFLDLA